MNNYSEEEIKETRNLISNGVYGLTANINNLEVWFSGKTLEDISDEMIEFALDIVKSYPEKKDKYMSEALEAVRDCLVDGDEVDDSTILDQFGDPIVSVSTKSGACIMYGGVEEIGDHSPEVRLNRNLEVEEVALNG